MCAAIIWISPLVAVAQGVSFLKPPSIAVMDFEVSMSVIKDLDRSHYGQLVSQALLSVLVQQNASERVLVPSGTPAGSLARFVDPGQPVYPEAPVARGQAADPGVVRQYFPPIFKIYDKKYVELALQQNAYQAKDLYSMNASAYAFSQLDFLVLGNVYETVYPGTRNAAIGFNVRVLNTRRAEELYSYTAIVDDRLGDLPAACSRIARLIMRDILDNHCAQFKVSQGPELRAIMSGQVPEGAAAAAGQIYEYLLFWQPRQVVRDDATVGDSGDAHKRPVAEDVFYWALPGQYTLSVYNRREQQLKAIPFSLSTGEIHHLVLTEDHLRVDNGSVTIGGVLPSDSYTFEFRPQAQQERYRWEIDTEVRLPDAFTVRFADGKPVVSEGQPAVKVDYRPASSELVIREVSPAGYQVVATADPPSSAGSVTGWWVVSSQLSTTSQPMTLDLRAKKDMVVPIADFKLQARKALVSPRLNKVTFLLKQGFGSSARLYISDSVNWSILRWSDKEKVTITSEYSQADWDSLPVVTYSFQLGYKPAGGKGIVTFTYSRTFRKTELEPSRDTIVVLDLEAIHAEVEAARKAMTAPRAASAGMSLLPTVSGAASPATASQAGASASAAPSAPAAPPVAASSSGAVTGTAGVRAAAVQTKIVAQIGLGLGSGTMTYTEPDLSTTTITTDVEELTISGSDVAISSAVLFPVAETLAMGVGAFMHFQSFSATDVSDANIDVDGVSGVALTFNVAAGNLSDGFSFIADVGFGTGFTLGAGFASRKAGSALGFMLRGGLMFDSVADMDLTFNSRDYPASNVSFSLVAGLFGG